MNVVEVGFSTDNGNALPRIIGYSVAFHVLVALIVFGVAMVAPNRDAKKIPVFQLVQLPQPKRIHHRPVPVVPKTEPTPVAPPKEIPKPVAKQLPPKIEVAPKDVKPAPKVEETPPPPQTTTTPTPNTDTQEKWDVDDLDGPDDGPDIVDNDLPQLRAVGDVVMDPLMQDYLERLQKEIMSRFSPPDGLTISQGSKSTVAFTIQRGGNFSNISLKQSSGNATWDRLAMRAVQLARPMQLPGVYREQYLPLVFDFKQHR